MSVTMPTLSFLALSEDDDEEDDDEELESELDESSEPHAVSPTGMTNSARTTARNPRTGDRVMAGQAIRRCGATEPLSAVIRRRRPRSPSASRRAARPRRSRT